VAKPKLQLVPPATKNGTVGKSPPIRPKNEDLREREHLRPEEIERLIEAARGNRHGGRDALMILMAYRHGLRASEVTDLKWEQVDFDRSEIHVNRLKGGTPATHPLTGRELRELRRHKRGSPPASFVFVSERGAPLTPPGFNRMVKRAAVAAKLGRRTPTCCATPAGSSSPMTGSIPGRYRPTSGTAISRIRLAIRRWRRGGSRTFGGTDATIGKLTYSSDAADE
jgi:integrase